jgi:hypothetical protein
MSEYIRRKYATGWYFSTGYDGNQGCYMRGDEIKNILADVEEKGSERAVVTFNKNGFKVMDIEYYVPYNEETVKRLQREMKLGELEKSFWKRLKFLI